MDTVKGWSGASDGKVVTTRRIGRQNLIVLPRHPTLLSDNDLRAWIEHLVNDAVEEGPTLDYKEIQGLDKPSERREIARDVSSFANQSGGVVLYGIPEERVRTGPPRPRAPYGIDRIPGFEERAENILVDSIRPRLPEYNIRSVAITDRPEKVVYVAWTPESWVGVHMVQAYDDNRYYHRGQYRAIEMTETEIRERYERILRKGAHVDDFLESRELDYIRHRVPPGFTSHYVAVPLIFDEHRVDFAVDPVYTWIDRNPYRPTGYAPSMYGVRSARLLIDGARGTWGPYTELYHNGAISHWREAKITQVDRTDPNPRLALAYVAELEQVQEFLKYAGRYYEVVSYFGPLRILITIDHQRRGGEMSRILFPYAQFSGDWPTLLTHNERLTLTAEPSAIDLKASPNLILKELADQMYRAFGYWEATCFDEDLNLGSEH